MAEFQSFGCLISTCFQHNYKDLISIDIANEGNVRDLYHEIDPFLVLLPAAIADVDYCEHYPQRSWMVNVRAPTVLAELCAVSGAQLVFFSSDYVFSGECGPYSETDIVGPVNVYGRHKLAAERAVLDRNPNALVIRTSCVYGQRLHPPDPIATLMAAIARGEPQGVPADQWNSPTNVVDLCVGVRLLVERCQAGIFHLAGPVRCTRLDYAKAICKAFGGCPDLIFSQSRRSESAPRPLSCGLRIDKAKKAVGYKARHYLVGLSELHERSTIQQDPF
jgi:dTDP-4-dehydrorhamnose reductase